MHVPWAARLLGVVLLVLIVEGVQAQSAGRIVGSVAAARGGEGLPGVNVVVIGTLHAAVTDAQGRFVIEPVPPDTYVVAVQALGYQPEQQEVELGAGGEAVLTFRLRVLDVEVEQFEEAVVQQVAQPAGGLDEARLQEAHLRMTGALLRSLPGNDAAHRGPLDAMPVVRGLWGNQVGVYADGVRFLAGSPYGLGSPLSLFDPAAVSAIEVVKGPYALTWGGGFLGAIRVVPPAAVAPDTRRHGAIQAGYTSRLDAFETAGSLAGATGKLSYRGDGTFRTGGAYHDGRGRDVPYGFQTVAVRGQAAYRFTPSTRLVAHAGYREGWDVDAPIYGGFVAQTDAADASVRFQTAWALGILRGLEGAVSWNRRVQTLNSNATDAESLSRNLEATQTQLGGRLTAQLAPAEGWTAEVGGDVYSDLHDVSLQRGGEALSPILRNARVTNLGFFARGTRLFGRGEATGTLRVDVAPARASASEDFLNRSGVQQTALRRTETGISGAAAVAVDLSSLWRFSVGLGSVVRTADAYERFADGAPFRRAAPVVAVLGTPNLSSERSTQADAWLRAVYPALTLQLGAFVRRLNAYITLARATNGSVAADTLGAATFRYVNDDATFYGLEGEMTYALFGEFVTLHAAGHYLWGHNDTQDEPVYGIAPASVQLGGRLAAPANLFFLEGVLRGTFKQTRVAEARGEIPTDGYVTADLHLGVSLPRSATLLMGLDNLTDTAYAHHLNPVRLDTGQRLTEPGRTFFIRVRYLF